MICNGKCLSINRICINVSMYNFYEKLSPVLKVNFGTQQLFNLKLLLLNNFVKFELL